VGENEGFAVGDIVGICDDFVDGENDGFIVGYWDGGLVGLNVGNCDGL